MFKSVRKNSKGILLMVFSSVFACIGQLLFKLAATGGYYYIFGGFCFYIIGALSMLIAYRYGRLSVLQPVLSLNYIISLFLGVTVLKETLSFLKVAGVLIVTCGVIMIAIGDRE